LLAEVGPGTHADIRRAEARGIGSVVVGLGL
jgi:hypothetical protein